MKRMMSHAANGPQPAFDARGSRRMRAATGTFGGARGAPAPGGDPGARRWLPTLWTLVLLSLLVTLAGCASGGGREHADMAGSAAPPQEPAAPSEPAPLPAPPPDDRPHLNRVALLVPVSGGNARVGQSIANAANLALLDVNAGFSLGTYDTALGAAQAAERARQDGASLFLGPLLAADVRGVQGTAAAAAVPVLTFSNDASLADGNTFVLGFQPDQSVARVVAHARARGIVRFAALVPAGVYGQRASAAFVRAVQQGGGKVVAVETFRRNAGQLNAAVRRVTNYEARAARAAQAGMVRPDGTVAPVQERLGPVEFQALLIADTADVAARFLPLLTQFGAGPGKVRLLGTELWGNEPGLASLEGMRGAWFAAVPERRFDQLASRYQGRFGARPSRLASLGYDAVLLAHAVASDWPVGAPFPRHRLTAPEGFVGVDGLFRLREDGIAERALEVREVRPGGFATVAAPPRSLAGPAGGLVN